MKEWILFKHDVSAASSRLWVLLFAIDHNTRLTIVLQETCTYTTKGQSLEETRISKSAKGAAKWSYTRRKHWHDDTTSQNPPAVQTDAWIRGHFSCQISLSISPIPHDLAALRQIRAYDCYYVFTGASGRKLCYCLHGTTCIIQWRIKLITTMPPPQPSKFGLEQTWECRIVQWESKLCYRTLWHLVLNLDLVQFRLHMHACSKSRINGWIGWRVQLNRI